MPRLQGLVNKWVNINKSHAGYDEKRGHFSKPSCPPLSLNKCKKGHLVGEDYSIRTRSTAVTASSSLATPPSASPEAARNAATTSSDRYSTQRSGLHESLTKHEDPNNISSAVAAPSMSTKTSRIRNEPSMLPKNSSHLIRRKSRTKLKRTNSQSDLLRKRFEEETKKHAVAAAAAVTQAREKVNQHDERQLGTKEQFEENSFWVNNTATQHGYHRRDRHTGSMLEVPDPPSTLPQTSSKTSSIEEEPSSSNLNNTSLPSVSIEQLFNPLAPEKKSNVRVEKSDDFGDEDHNHSGSLTPAQNHYLQHRFSNTTHYHRHSSIVTTTCGSSISSMEDEDFADDGRITGATGGASERYAYGIEPSPFMFTPSPPNHITMPVPIHYQQRHHAHSFRQEYYHHSHRHKQLDPQHQQHEVGEEVDARKESRRYQESIAVMEARQKFVEIMTLHKRQLEKMAREQAKWQNDVNNTLSHLENTCQELLENGRILESNVSFGVPSKSSVFTKEEQEDMEKIKTERDTYALQVKILKTKLELQASNSMKPDIPVDGCDPAVNTDTGRILSITTTKPPEGTGLMQEEAGDLISRHSGRSNTVGLAKSDRKCEEVEKEIDGDRDATCAEEEESFTQFEFD